MTGEREEYELGEDVTALAGQKPRRRTVVLSVRLPVEDVATIESLSRTTGKSVSQVVREAVHGFMRFSQEGQPVITISIPEGASFSTSGPRQTTKAISMRQGPERELVRS